MPEQTPKTKPRPINDPLVRAVKKAYRESPQCELDNLLAEESRWKRKATIAQNKLSDVRERLNKFAQRILTPEKDEGPKACVYCGDPECTNPSDCPVRRQHVEEDRAEG